MRQALALVFVVTLGCGGGGDDDDDDGNSGGTGSLNAPSCSEDEFALTGTIGAEAVSTRGTLDGHAWIQSSMTSSFDGLLADGGHVHLEWLEVVADGERTAVTGWLTPPAGAPRAGERIEAGAGTMSKLDEEVRFQLDQLSVAVTCVTAPCPAESVDGSLGGCTRWHPIN